METILSYSDMGSNIRIFFLVIHQYAVWVLASVFSVPLFPSQPKHVLPTYFLRIWGLLIVVVVFLVCLFVCFFPLLLAFFCWFGFVLFCGYFIFFVCFLIFFWFSSLTKFGWKTFNAPCFLCLGRFLLYLELPLGAGVSAQGYWDLDGNQSNTFEQKASLLENSGWSSGWSSG